ncbi:DUF3239 domain-containing protein [Corynebacterium hindlerae]|uniref:DUF3239 domain-containing protein n=1 Tax=Corynebacterium hindlerae TaxID=699041 RepID=A0A7G5FGY1_9CORY|nr:DUF3239 domain-containing protein [Corynebacterium hindlerae]QMV85872.1 DUF3239 domain-containing protein [Corynebacterium hindlerae]
MRTFSFPINPEHNKQNNEFSRDAVRLQISAGVFGLILAVIAFFVFRISDGAIWGLAVTIGLAAFAAFCFLLIFILPRQMGSAQQMFDRYPLVPAVVAEVEPRGMVLMALVDANASESGKPIPALAIRNISNLRGHERVVGERVPAVAVSGRRSVSSKDRWDEISPMPIAWGTPDMDVVKEAQKAIPENEWNRLHKCLERLDDVKANPMNLLVL